MSQVSEVARRPTSIPPVWIFAALVLVALALTLLALSAGETATLVKNFPASGTEVSAARGDTRLVITWETMTGESRCLGNIWLGQKKDDVWQVFPIPLWPIDFPKPCSWKVLRDQLNLADAYYERDTHMGLRDLFRLLRDIMARRFG